MERAPDGRILVASDTNVLINFLRVGRLDLLCRHRDYRFVVTEHARAEITDPAQHAALEAAVSAGDIGATSLTDPAELTLFATLNAFLGRGESAAMAVAAVRNWVVATDETRRARREIESRMGLGRQLTTPGILLRCILNSALSIADADAIKAQLAAQRFVMKFRTFADLPTPELLARLRALAVRDEVPHLRRPPPEAPGAIAAREAARHLLTAPMSPRRPPSPLLRAGPVLPQRRFVPRSPWNDSSASCAGFSRSGSSGPW